MSIITVGNFSVDTYKPLPSQTNNPFSLIQQVPSSWRGLVGKLPNGFLIFDSIENGTRAGFINLINTYINAGLNTIAKIFPQYAPSSDPSNNPAAYIASVSQQTGIDPDAEVTTSDQIYKIGQAIIKVEQGNFWVPLDAFNSGFTSAMEAKQIKIVAVAAAVGSGVLLLVGLFFLVFKTVESGKS